VAFAQDAAPAGQQVIRFSGAIDDGASFAGAEATLHFAVYDHETDGQLLWQEVQTAALDSGGRYTVLLGDTSRGGVPATLFATASPRWLSVGGPARPPGPGCSSRPCRMRWRRPRPATPVPWRDARRPTTC